jgi:hypothetical protein
VSLVETHTLSAAREVPPEILPLSLRLLFRAPCTLYMRGTFIAVLLGRYVEEQVSKGAKIEGSEPRGTRLVGNRAEAAASDIQRRLNRLMPFDEWCATLKPTETAKELYLFVRARLEMRAAEALARLQSGGSERRERSRKSKTSSPPASDEAIDEQR